MSKFTHSLKHLIHEMIPPAAFFFITFQLLAFTRALMLKRYGIDATTFLTTTIGALVAAKVVVLADLLPLIYNIAWKTPIYFVAAFVVHYLEELFDCNRKTGDLASAMTVDVVAVPEPSILALTGLGISSLLFLRPRRKN